MATQTKLNSINISHILRHIWLHSGVSRIELSKTLSMDKSTVTKIVSQLLEIGIIKTQKEGEAGSHGGRKPIPLVIDLAYGCIIGLEIQTDSYSAVIIDLNGEILFKRAESIDFYDKSLQQVFFEILEKIRPETEKRNLRTLGVCLGISGIVDNTQGIIYKSNPLRITEELHLRKEVENTIQVPVFIENDANCGCWGELATRKAERTENMLFVLGEFREVETKHTYYSGVGVGFGIVINGQVLHGKDFSVGEFKSVFCGDQPSISQFSMPDIEIEHIEKKPDQLNKLLYELCQNIAYTVNILDLNEIVFGGPLVQYEQEISEKLNHLIHSNWLHPDQVSYNIRYSKLDSISVSYGAACMFLENLFGIPEVSEAEEDSQLRGIELLKHIN